MADLDIRTRNGDEDHNCSPSAGGFSACVVCGAEGYEADEDVTCESCGRTEFDCSRDPCDDVLADREEEACTFSKYDYNSYGCSCARCERHKYPDV